MVDKNYLSIKKEIEIVIETAIERSLNTPEFESIRN
jgi:hypothetical protein